MERGRGLGQTERVASEGVAGWGETVRQFVRKRSVDRISFTLGRVV